MTHTHDWNTRATRAASVFGESAAAGYVLGGATAFLSVVIAGVAVGGGERWGGVLVYAFFGAGIGGGIGLVVGMLVGVALYLVVRIGEPRCGVRAVAGAFPVVALGMTLPVAVLVGSVAGVAWLVSVVTLDAVLTLVGAKLIARHYLRRCEPAHVH